jgi:glycosyltransferase 2 family protein
MSILSEAPASSTKQWLVRGLVSAVLISMVLYGVDLHALRHIFASIDYYYFGWIVLLSLTDRFLMAYKWHLLLRVRGVNLSLWAGLKAYLISGFFGAFLPASIGGDIYRVYYTARKVQHTDEVVASVVVERAIGVIASATFALFGLVVMIGFFSQHFSHGKLIMTVVLVLAVSSIGFWVSLHEKLFAFVEHVLERWKNQRIVQKVLRCHRAYIGYKAVDGVLLVFFFLSVIEQSLFSLMNYYAAKALHMDIGLLYFIGIIPICHLLMRLPVSINAIGVQEGLYVFFFSRLGLTVTEAFSLALLIRVVWLLVHLASMILYLTDGLVERVALQKVPDKITST